MTGRAKTRPRPSISRYRTPLTKPIAQDADLPFRQFQQPANDRATDFRIFREVNSLEATYCAGTEFLTAGDTSRMMYIIKKGVIAVQIHDVTVEQISEGSIFGEMGIVDPRPHTARVVALTDVILFGLTEQQFLKLTSTTPTFALRVMRVLARKIRAMNSRLPDMVESKDRLLGARPIASRAATPTCKSASR